MASVVERVQLQAAQVRVIRVLLSVVAAPFYVLGLTVAVLWVAVSWCIAAAQVGFADVRKRGDG